jgi:hypothetical protein
VKVDFAGAESLIGSYTAKLTYNGMPIEPYPFEFNVASEEGLQKAIHQDPSAPTINIYIPITVFGGGGITITIIAWSLWNRRKKEK